jgi:hypothetical protein
VHLQHNPDLRIELLDLYQLGAAAAVLIDRIRVLPLLLLRAECELCAT